MREITIDELKELQLEMLKKIHSFCEKHRIQYFLGYGTLIGAVRHKGYIPWDDDIDIIMPRSDYDRFVQMFNGVDPVLKLYAPEINPNYYAPYANIVDTRTVLIEKEMSHRGMQLGIKIDVFPIDSVPQDLVDYQNFYNKMIRYNKILRVKRIKFQSIEGYRKFFILVKKILYGLYSYSSIQKKIMDSVHRVKNSESSYVDNAVFTVYHNKRFKKELIKSAVKVEFEGFLFNAPVGYDKYLRTIYGDYMSLPPEDKRVPHHGFTAYWKK